MAFDENTIANVWSKGVSSIDANWRKDACGAWMYFPHYGNRDSDYGWEIDHITPKGKGGSDDLFNLRPLQWQNNVSKASGGLDCVITAHGQANGPV